MVFQKIMVALDRSSQAPLVFAQALTIASDSELLLFSCLDWQAEGVNPWIGIGTLADIEVSGDWYRLRHESLQKDLEQIRNWLETYRQQAIAKNIAVQCEAKVGNPSLAICDRASEWGADLIVLGRRGHKGISELLLGSVSNHVIHHAPCSVLIVQGLPSPEVDESVSATETEAKS